MILVLTNLFIPSRFLDYTDMKFDTCCQRYIATCGKKKSYRCTSTFSALNYCSGIFFSNPSALYMIWCALTFPPIFKKNFSTFDCHFLEILPANENENYVVHLKEQSLL